MKKYFLLFNLLFTICCTALFAQPANDNLCDATPITLGEMCDGTSNIILDMATAETNEPQLTCGTATDDTLVYNSVWYSFVAPANEVYILAAADFPTTFNFYQMNLFTLGGDCADLSNLELVQCATATQNLLSSPSMQLTLTEGETYYAQVFGRTATFTMGTYSSPGCFTVMEVSPPANDDVCNAVNLELNGAPQVFSNIGATSQPGEFPLSPPPGGNPLATDNDGWALGTNFIDNSVWFTFTTPAEGGNVTIDLSSSFGLPGNYNTQLAVYEAADCNDFSTFSLVAAGDNGLPPGGGFLSVNPTLDLFCLEGNKTYHVLVDGGASFLFMPIASQGYFSIQISAPDPIPLSLATVSENTLCPEGGDGTLIAVGQGGAGGFTYTWSNGDSTAALIDVLEAGEYTLTVTDQCGEEIVDTFTLGTSLDENVMADAGMDLSGCSDSEIQLNISASGGLQLDSERMFLQRFGETSNLTLRSAWPLLQELTSVVSDDQTDQFSEMEFVGTELYGYTFDSLLYQVNTSTGEQTLIGQIMNATLIDLSYVPSSGKLFGVDRMGNIIDIDPTTAEHTLAMATNLEFIAHGAIDNSETFYAFMENSDMYAVPLSTGTPELITTLPFNPFPVRGMEIDPSNDLMYITSSFTVAQGSGITWQQTIELDKATGESLNSYRDFSTNGAPTISFAIGERTVEPYEYEWSPSANLDDATIASPSFTLTETETFTVNVFDWCGSSADDEVTVDLLPDAAETIDVEVVSGEEYNGVVYTENTTLMETLLAANGCDSVLTTNIIVTPNTVGEGWPDAIITLSPNPANDLLTLSTVGMLETDATVSIMDLFGRRVLSTNFQAGSMTIDVSDLSAGQYIVEIRNAEKFAARRLLKK